MIMNLFTVVRQKIKKIVLFHNNNHYDYIKSLPACFNEKNSASFVVNLIKMIFFTNVSKYVNYVREKRVKKR